VTYAPLSRMASLALVTLVAGAILAACGSSSSTSKTSSTAAGGGGARRTALVTCLRKHGVTLPAGGRAPGAPASGGGAPRGPGAPGAGGPGGPGGKFGSAFKACGASFPRGGVGGFSRTAITKYVTCVRQHGYALPKPNFSGRGSVFPASVRSNSKFQSANRACQSLLRPSGSPGAPPGA
jgi:hypothetical protein